MSQLEALKSASKLKHVADLLGFRPYGLAYILYKKPPSSNYSKFTIPKRRGGLREISAPSSDLKLLQRNLANLLQNCVEELNARHGLADSISHGFKRKRSIITNAYQHKNRRYVFNLDLKDFFPSINFGRVRGFFIQDRNFELHEKVATVLSQIACVDNALPQGSPCSPVISNLIGHILDIHLVRLAIRNSCVYSRYADDLTFSTNLKSFPIEIAVESSPNVWEVGKELDRLVAKSGFSINYEKVRMQYRDSRQDVTGLVVNKRVNIRSEYRHTVRAMVHRLFTTGKFEIEGIATNATGAKVRAKVEGKKEQLHGMLGFIDDVDREVSKRIADGGGVVVRQRARDLIYRRFLLFSELYAAKSPVIICEGKTDYVYLVHAIRSLVSSFPKLATKKSDGAIAIRPRLYRYSTGSTGRILGIQGGSGDLKNLIVSYRDEIKRFTAPGKEHPVVVVIDNDDGAGDIFNLIGQITKTKAMRSANFLHVIGNLYVVPTPLSGTKTISTIEDFFDAKTKNVPINGKTFDPRATDSSVHYGKTVFAHKVVAANAKSIDFSGFSPLLRSIVLAIEDHEKRFPPGGT